jgi:hypothetical protein
MTATQPTNITRDDLEKKMRELQGEVGVATESIAGYVVIGGAVAIVLVVGMAYYFGRRRGRRRTTVVEVRRL